MPDLLTGIRRPLLDLHRALLDAERSDMERFQGRLSSAEFLQIATGGIRLGWLQPLSELIVALDEALEVGPDDDPPDPQAIVDRARELVAPPDDGTPFGRRYLSLLQGDPAVVLAHAALVRALEG